MQQSMLVFVLLVSSVIAHHQDWSSLDSLLRERIPAGVYPGCTAIVGDLEHIYYHKAFGTLSRDKDSPAVHLNTLYDMASLTKVTMATTAAMTFYQRGELHLDTKISDSRLLGDEFKPNGKENITVQNLLLHDAGFPPDPSPNYFEMSFGCPETHPPTPPRLAFSCRAKVYHSVLKQYLQNPVGEVYVYSDLSMITLMFVLGKLAKDLRYISFDDLNPLCVGSDTETSVGIEQCYYLAYVDKFVIGKVGMKNSMFLPPNPIKKKCAVTPVTYPIYRNSSGRGEVQDCNTFAMGGVSGHAGLFSTSLDAYKLIRTILGASADDPWINSTTVEKFTTIVNAAQSSRALGWDTNDYNVRSYSGCGNFSQKTFMHTGYTGTQICADKERKLIGILLTNADTPTASPVTEARRDFSNKVIEIFDSISVHNIL
jgi:CubicO group peptidase (beta-lactamase class C family)